MFRSQGVDETRKFSPISLLRSTRISPRQIKKGDIQDAIEAIQAAEELVADRKKKIKIADSSKAGWNTVQHMEKRDSGQTSEERKRIQVAEESALKEIDARKRQKVRPTTFSRGNEALGDRYLFQSTYIL